MKRLLSKIKGVGLERTFGGCGPTFYSAQGQLGQFTQALPGKIWITSGMDCKSFLSNLFQNWITHVEKKNQNTGKNLPYCNLTYFISWPNVRSWSSLVLRLLHFWQKFMLRGEVTKQGKKKLVLPNENCTACSFSKAQEITHGLASKQPQFQMLMNKEIKNDIWQTYCFLSLEGNVCLRQAHLKCP